MSLNKINVLLNGIIDCSRLLGLPEVDIVHAKEFLSYNEQGLCLDQIITQLYEYNIGVNNDIYTLVEMAAQKLSIPIEQYSYLKELIKNENVIPNAVKIQITNIVKDVLEKDSR